MEDQQRYDTEITREHFYKYRPRNDLTPSSLFYGSDKEMLLKTGLGFQKGAIFGTGAALFAATYDPAGFDISRAAQRSFRHGVPWVLGGTVYGVTVSSAATLRNKDGPLNHVLGGLAAGAMVGSWYKNKIIGSYVAAILATVGGVIKLLVDTDTLPKPYPRKPRVFNFYRTGWFTERPDPEGKQDGDDTFRRYNPHVK